MKDIIGWEGRYAVTEEGRIWHYPETRECGHRWGKIIRHDKGRWMAINTTKKGDWYYSISLGVGNKRKGYKVHRLVAQAFIPNPKKLPEVNHKNGDKGDNRIENLEWCTRIENLAAALKTFPIEKRNFQRGEANYWHKLTEENVRQIKKRFYAGELSQRKLAKEYGVSHTTVKGIINGWHWKGVE